mmetsp:Transcript_7454/g.15437  ORF Transcript_7454/g.15437 Transcript_7454/m.15437 type:complete len:121 (-) Transcript_7454:30-392(-)
MRIDIMCSSVHRGNIVSLLTGAGCRTHRVHAPPDDRAVVAPSQELEAQCVGTGPVKKRTSCVCEEERHADDSIAHSFTWNYISIPSILNTYIYTYIVRVSQRGDRRCSQTEETEYLQILK